MTRGTTALCDFGKTVYRIWLAFARRLGRINGAILLSLSFYLLVLPVALARRLTRGSVSAEKGWVKRRPLPDGHYYKQY